MVEPPEDVFALSDRELVEYVAEIEESDLMPPRTQWWLLSRRLIALGIVLPTDLVGDFDRLHLFARLWLELDDDA